MPKSFNTRGSSAASGVGSLLNVQRLAADGTYTPTPGTKKVKLRMVGAGGGGGGVPACSAGNGSAASGGSSGMYLEKWINPDSDIIGGDAVIGAGGAGGAAGQNSGSAGGDTTIEIQGVTYTAKGGSGGGSMNAASTDPEYASSSFPDAGSSVGDLNTLGGGLIGYRIGVGLKVYGWGGMGGSCPFGAGGVTQGVAAVGANGQGFGAGGGGAVNYSAAGTAAAKAGGNGTAGLIIIEEYA